VGTELVGHENTICDIKFSLDKKSIMSCSSDSSIRYWNF